jgi:cytosine/adenosine deaminase-related metal-dependent hydrolase
VSGGPDPSIFGVMRVGALSQMGLRAVAARGAAGAGAARLAPARDDRRGPGARLDGAIGSLEAGKEADMIVVDPAMTSPLRGARDGGSWRSSTTRRARQPADLPAHPDMVRGAWVRGRLLEGTS